MGLLATQTLWQMAHLVGTACFRHRKASDCFSNALKSYGSLVMKRATIPIQLPDDLITLPETAALLKIENKTCYRWADTWLPVYKLGSRCLRFSKREVLEAVAKHRIVGIGQ